MSDLVERLRDAGTERSGSSIRNGCAECGLNANLCNETADRIADLEAYVERLREVNAELLAALKLNVSDNKENLADAGGCDHSVGICFCGVIRNIEIGERAIARAEARK